MDYLAQVIRQVWPAEQIALVVGRID